MNGLTMPTANACQNVFLLLPVPLERNGISEPAGVSARVYIIVHPLRFGMSLLAHANARLMDCVLPLRDGTPKPANANVLQFAYVPPNKDGTPTPVNASAQVPISALP